MLSIINDIIDISKIESGQMNVSFSLTNINSIIESISLFLKREAEDKGIKLIYENTLSFEAVTITSDKEKINAILLNLVKNAIKFTHSGTVEFGYRKNEDNFEFFVKDTGIGISSDQKKFIFERFRQANESLTRNHEGTGLGLSISKAYAEMLGGSIWFESEYGKGSTFYFSLPYNSVVKSQPIINYEKSEGVEDQKIRGLVILIVEDNLPSEMLMTRLVRPFSKKILKVTNGKDAVDTCRNNSDIDLVLMDIKLPEMDGYEATLEIRKFNKDLIIIAQTAFGLMDERTKALESG